MNRTVSLKHLFLRQVTRTVAVRAGVAWLCLATASSPAQTYTVLHNFTGGDWAGPCAGLVLSGSALYGTTYGTYQGGTSNLGTVFKMNCDGTGFVVLKYFDGQNGANPVSGLLLSGATLYGTTVYGGNYGTVFKMNTDGSGFTVLRYFTGSDGAYPYGGLVLSGTSLYGVTSQGGGHGTVFRMNTNGSDFAVLKYFAGSDGAYPNGGLVLSGTTLYGTTAQGGIADASLPFGYGTVFRLATDGSGHTVLKYFNNSDGELPFDHLVLSGETLYGTTCWDGGATSVPGTMFKLHTDGSSFTVLKQFALSGEHYPGALLLSGTQLWGVTEFGGAGGYGTLYQINTDGSGYALLKQFDGSDGATPHGDLVLSGAMLYGTTQSGGSSGGGVVFALLLPPPSMVVAPSSQTAELGSTASFAVRVSSYLPPTFRWLVNGDAIAGCTNPVLSLVGVQATNAGAYTVVIINAAGGVTSSPALFSVIQHVERRGVPGVQVTGQTGSLLNVDYADSLSPAPTWTPLGSVSLTGAPQYCFDLTLPLPPQRFYRAWQAGTPGVRPSLDLHLVPAVTLTGSIGHSVRLDYINQFGPTDAWATLATVPLTNTSQLYFDTSSIGQPARLWRIVPMP